MKQTSRVLAGALAVLVLGGCAYRDTADDGSGKRARPGGEAAPELPVRTPGKQPSPTAPAPAQQPTPAPDAPYRPWGFHDPGPNYPWTGP